MDFEFTDAVGLGLFTVLGVNVAIDAGYGDYHRFRDFSRYADGGRRRDASGYSGGVDAGDLEKAYIRLRVASWSGVL